MMRRLAMAACVAAAALLAGGQRAVPDPAAASARPETPHLGGSLIVEPGQPALAAQTLVVRDGRIAGIEAGYRPGHDPAALIDLRGQTILPGLIDSHVHLLSELGPSGRLDMVTKSEADWTLDGLNNARKTLEAGFTTVADLGSGQGGRAIFALRDQFASGRLVGPRIVAAGSTITPSGGHADVHGYRDDVMHVLARESVCNGADDCRRAVREQVRQGADIIKVTATGGVLSNTAAGLGQQFTDAELQAIAETAHAMGRQVTAHAHGKAGIEAALRAGFDSIEHGSYLDAATIALFRAREAWLVPTVLAGVTVAELAAQPGSTLTPAQAAKAREVGPLMFDMLRRARAGGVRIAFGTDSGVSRHGDNARELEIMVQAGFSPAEALRAATVHAANHLGLSAEIGTLESGKAADIIAVAGDPYANIGLMRDVRFVMRAGRVAKRI